MWTCRMTEEDVVYRISNRNVWKHRQNGQRKISEQHQQDLVGGGIKPFELKKISRADIFKFRRSEIKPKTHGRDHNRVEELLFLYAKGKWITKRLQFDKYLVHTHTYTSIDYDEIRGNNNELLFFFLVLVLVLNEQQWRHGCGKRKFEFLGYLLLNYEI